MRSEYKFMNTFITNKLSDNSEKSLTTILKQVALLECTRISQNDYIERKHLNTTYINISKYFNTLNCIFHFYFFILIKNFIIIVVFKCFRSFS